MFESSELDEKIDIWPTTKNNTNSTNNNNTFDTNNNSSSNNAPLLMKSHSLRLLLSLLLLEKMAQTNISDIDFSSPSPSSSSSPQSLKPINSLESPYSNENDEFIHGVFHWLHTKYPHLITSSSSQTTTSPSSSSLSSFITSSVLHKNDSNYYKSTRKMQHQQQFLANQRQFAANSAQSSLSATDSAFVANANANANANIDLLQQTTSGVALTNGGDLQNNTATRRPYFGDAFFAFQLMCWQLHCFACIIICTLGIFANVTNIIVLTRPNMVTAVNAILCAMAVADLVVNISNIPYLTHELSDSSNLTAFYSAHWALYILMHAHITVTAHTISIWLTCVLATWRYFVVCRSSGSDKRNWSVSLAKRAIAAVVLLVPLVCIPNYLSFSIVAEQTTLTPQASNAPSSLPTASEYQSTPPTTLPLPLVSPSLPELPPPQPEQPPLASQEATANDHQSVNITIYKVGFSRLADESVFIRTFHFGVFSCLTKLVPCVLLTYFTTVLIRKLFEAKERRLRLTTFSSNNSAPINAQLSSNEARRFSAVKQTALLATPAALELGRQRPQSANAAAPPLPPTTTALEQQSTTAESCVQSLGSAKQLRVDVDSTNKLSTTTTATQSTDNAPIQFEQQTRSASTCGQLEFDCENNESKLLKTQAVSSNQLETSKQQEITSNKNKNNNNLIFLNRRQSAQQQSTTASSTTKLNNGLHFTGKRNSATTCASAAISFESLAGSQANNLSSTTHAFNANIKTPTISKLNATKHKQVSQNETTTQLLIAVMIVFLICEFPAGILAALCAILGQDFFENVYQPCGFITDLLALINSSVNFILYCFMSTQFRDTFYKVVLRCPAPNTQNSQMPLLSNQKKLLSNNNTINTNNSLSTNVRQQTTLTSNNCNHRQTNDRQK